MGVGGVRGGRGEGDLQSAKTCGGQTELGSFTFTVAAERSHIQEVTPPSPPALHCVFFYWWGW